ncbi:hypothetical protein MBLNU230_g4325t1 [Neophaeotheca triangularis]
MPPSTVHLPNGQTLTVTPVFGGLYFKSNELQTGAQPHAFPAGWTIQIHSEDDEDEDGPQPSTAAHSSPHQNQYPGEENERRIHRFKTPTLKNDHIFISSISNPSSNDFRPPTSPTRQIASMTWATLWWYFHQPAPSPYLATAASKSTPEEGRPKGEWRVNIDRAGIFKGKHLLPKLERMGLIASEDSSVGIDPEDGVVSAGESWTSMFVSRRSFWQLDARIYLFTLPPLQPASPYPAVSPSNSRPASPNRNSTLSINENSAPGTPALHSTHGSNSGLWRSATPPGPFTSGSHLPTFYPPPPVQYTNTNGTRHPIRPKPPRQGETFYTRYIPSLGQYLSFRIASLSSKPCQYRGPLGSNTTDATLSPGVRDSLRSGATGTPTSVPSSETNSLAAISRMNLEDRDTTQLNDVELLHKWMNDPRVAYSWGEQGPLSHQRAFLEHGLTSKHSFPVIGCFDGRPFGFFEIYWVKEDRLAAHLGGSIGRAGDWDRGLHVLVGEQEFRGSHRVKVWLSALIHYCWLADMRTGNIMMEPRVDNHKLKRYLEEAGFHKEKEVAFSHKQSNLMVISRDAWEAPAI